MRYNIISYLIGEGFRNFFKNKKSTVVSITTMCLTMIMFGVFFILGENVNHVMKNIEQQQGMQVYLLNKKITDEEIRNIEEEIREINGVNTVKYVSSEESLRQAKEQLKNIESFEKFTEGMPEDSIQPSFTVTLTDLSLNEEVQNQIKDKVGKDNVEIVAQNQTIGTLESIAKGLKIGILVLLISLMVISIFIISNTIKLSVHARRKEISIMKYVGATNGFIRWPFIVEGIIIGIVSALITILIVGLAYNAIAAKAVQTSLLQQLNISLVSFNDMFSLILTIYLITGAGIGILGSSISMRKYLQV